MKQTNVISGDLSISTMNELLKGLQTHCDILHNEEMELFCLVVCRGDWYVCGSELGQQFVNTNPDLPKIFLNFIGDEIKAKVENKEGGVGQNSIGKGKLEEPFSLQNNFESQISGANDEDIEDNSLNVSCIKSEPVENKDEKQEQSKRNSVREPEDKREADEDHVNRGDDLKDGGIKQVIEENNYINKRAILIPKKTRGRKPKSARKRGRLWKHPIPANVPDLPEGNQETDADNHESGRGFTQSGSLNNHMRSHTEERLFMCEKCNKSFTWAKTLRKHLLTIHTTREKTFVCKICSKAFLGADGLKQHLKMHAGVKPFLCQECGQSFSQSGNLNTHMRIHTGERPFVCKVCNKTFKTSDHLNKHLQIHTGERPFVCDRCSKAFIALHQLKQHYRIHTGEKPYICKECGKAFAVNCNLKQHLRTHTGQKPYACMECGLNFTKSCALKEHMSTHKGDK